MMLRALLTIGAVQVVTMLVLLVRTKTLAVTLGPELVGVMAVIEKLLAVIAQTASLSLPFAAARFLPERWSAGPAEYRELFTRMRNVVLAMAGLATAGALLVTAWAPALWGEALLPYRDVVLVAALGLPVIALVPFLQNAIAGRLQQNRSMLVGLLQAVVLAVSVAGVFWGGLVGYYAAYAVLGTLLVAAASRFATEGTPRSAALAAPVLPASIWRFSGALLVLAFLVPYASLFVHYRLLREHGAEAAGWMQAAIGISLSVRAVIGSAHAVYLTPNVNRGGSPQERMGWANGFESTLCLVAALAVPPLLLFPHLVVSVLYSPAFLPGAAFVVFFVVAEVLLLLSGTYQSLVVAFDHLRFHVASNLVAQLLVVAFAVLLVEPLGILGAGLAALAAPLFLFASTTIFLHRTHGLRIPGRILARMAWLVAGLCATGALGAADDGFTARSLAVKAVVLAVFAAGTALLLTGDERSRIRETLEGWTRRWR